MPGLHAKPTACDLSKSTQQPSEGETINIPNHKWKKKTGSFQNEFFKMNRDNNLEANNYKSEYLSIGIWQKATEKFTQESRRKNISLTMRFNEDVCCVAIVSESKHFLRGGVIWRLRM